MSFCVANNYIDGYFLAYINDKGSHHKFTMSFSDFICKKVKATTGDLWNSPWPSLIAVKATDELHLSHCGNLKYNLKRPQFMFQIFSFPFWNWLIIPPLGECWGSKFKRGPNLLFMHFFNITPKSSNQYPFQSQHNYFSFMSLGHYYINCQFFL